jgi:hypothetical protein
MKFAGVIKKNNVSFTVVYVDVVFPLLQTRLLPDLTIKMSNTAGVFPLLQTRLLPVFLLLLKHL